jgi:hypothetical protein
MTHDVKARPLSGGGDMQKAIPYGSLRRACRIRNGMSITHRPRCIHYIQIYFAQAFCVLLTAFVTASPVLYR